jgi:hypothetical protein
MRLLAQDDEFKDAVTDLFRAMRQHLEDRHPTEDIEIVDSNDLIRHFQRIMTGANLGDGKGAPSRKPSIPVNVPCGLEDFDKLSIKPDVDEQDRHPLLFNLQSTNTEGNSLTRRKRKRQL